MSVRPGREHVRLALLVASLSAFVGLAAIALAPGGLRHRIRVAVADAVPPLSGPAPAFRLPRADGAGEIDLARMRGRAVALDFFASWCDPCNDEASALDAFARDAAPRGLDVVGVDVNEPASAARGFARKHAVRYPIAVDRDGAVGARYRVQGYPTLVLVRRDGRIARVFVGEATPALMRRLGDEALR